MEFKSDKNLIMYLTIGVVISAIFELLVYRNLGIIVMIFVSTTVTHDYIVPRLDYLCEKKK